MPQQAWIHQLHPSASSHRPTDPQHFSVHAPTQPHTHHLSASYSTTPLPLHHVHSQGEEAAAATEPMHAVNGRVLRPASAPPARLQMDAAGSTTPTPSPPMMHPPPTQQQQYAGQHSLPPQPPRARPSAAELLGGQNRTGPQQQPMQQYPPQHYEPDEKEQMVFAWQTQQAAPAFAQPQQHPFAQSQPFSYAPAASSSAAQQQEAMLYARRPPVAATMPVSAASLAARSGTGGGARRPTSASQRPPASVSAPVDPSISVAGTDEMWSSVYMQRLLSKKESGVAEATFFERSSSVLRQQAANTTAAYSATSRSARRTGWWQPPPNSELLSATLTPAQASAPIAWLAPTPLPAQLRDEAEQAQGGKGRKSRVFVPTDTTLLLQQWHEQSQPQLTHQPTVPVLQVASPSGLLPSASTPGVPSPSSSLQQALLSHFQHASRLFIGPDGNNRSPSASVVDDTMVAQLIDACGGFALVRDGRELMQVLWKMEMLPPGGDGDGPPFTSWPQLIDAVASAFDTAMHARSQQRKVLQRFLSAPDVQSRLLRPRVHGSLWGAEWLPSSPSSLNALNDTLERLMLAGGGAEGPGAVHQATRAQYHCQMLLNSAIAPFDSLESLEAALAHAHAATVHHARDMGAWLSNSHLCHLFAPDVNGMESASFSFEEMLSFFVANAAPDRDGPAQLAAALQELHARVDRGEADRVHDLRELSRVLERMRFSTSVSPPTSSPVRPGRSLSASPSPGSQQHPQQHQQHQQQQVQQRPLPSLSLRQPSFPQIRDVSDEDGEDEEEEDEDGEGEDEEEEARSDLDVAVELREEDTPKKVALIARRSQLRPQPPPSTRAAAGPSGGRPFSSPVYTSSAGRSSAAAPGAKTSKTPSAGASSPAPSVAAAATALQHLSDSEEDEAADRAHEEAARAALEAKWRAEAEAAAAKQRAQTPVRDATETTDSTAPSATSPVDLSREPVIASVAPSLSATPVSDPGESAPSATLPAATVTAAATPVVAQAEPVVAAVVTSPAMSPEAELRAVEPVTTHAVTPMPAAVPAAVAVEPEVLPKEQVAPSPEPHSASPPAVDPAANESSSPPVLSPVIAGSPDVVEEVKQAVVPMAESAAASSSTSRPVSRPSSASATKQPSIIDAAVVKSRPTSASVSRSGDARSSTTADDGAIRTPKRQVSPAPTAASRSPSVSVRRGSANAGTTLNAAEEPVEEEVLPPTPKREPSLSVSAQALDDTVETERPSDSPAEATAPVAEPPASAVNAVPMTPASLASVSAPEVAAPSVPAVAVLPDASSPPSVTPAAPASSTSVPQQAAAPESEHELCNICDEVVSTHSCDECALELCLPCSVALHKPARMAKHAVVKHASSSSTDTPPAESSSTTEPTLPTFAVAATPVVPPAAEAPHTGASALPEQHHAETIILSPVDSTSTVPASPSASPRNESSLPSSARPSPLPVASPTNGGSSITILEAIPESAASSPMRLPPSEEAAKDGGAAAAPAVADIRPAEDSKEAAKPPSVAVDASAKPSPAFVSQEPPLANAGSRTPSLTAASRPQSATPADEDSLCELCAARPATCFCSECDLKLCDADPTGVVPGIGCDAETHRPVQRMNHVRVPWSKDGGAAATKTPQSTSSIPPVNSPSLQRQLTLNGVTVPSLALTPKLAAQASLTASGGGGSSTVPPSPSLGAASTPANSLALLALASTPGSQPRSLLRATAPSPLMLSPTGTVRTLGVASLLSPATALASQTTPGGGATAATTGSPHWRNALARIVAKSPSRLGMAAVVGAAVAANGLSTPTTPSIFARALSARAAITPTSTAGATAAALAAAAPAVSPIQTAAQPTASPAAASGPVAPQPAAPAAATPAKPAPLCDICDDEPGVLLCEACDMHLCATDDAQLHKPAKMHSHVRKPV